MCCLLFYIFWHRLMLLVLNFAHCFVMDCALCTATMSESSKCARKKIMHLLNCSDIRIFCILKKRLAVASCHSKIFHMYQTVETRNICLFWIEWPFLHICATSVRHYHHPWYNCSHCLFKKGIQNVWRKKRKKDCKWAGFLHIIFFDISFVLCFVSYFSFVSFDVCVSFSIWISLVYRNCHRLEWWHSLYLFVFRSVPYLHLFLLINWFSIRTFWMTSKPVNFAVDLHTGDKQTINHTTCNVAMWDMIKRKPIFGRCEPFQSSLRPSKLLNVYVLHNGPDQINLHFSMHIGEEAKTTTKKKWN